MSAPQIRQYFGDIISKDFSEYQVRENVAVTDIVGNLEDSMQLYESRPYQAYKAEWGEPYTFVMYRNGVPKGIVMVGDKRSHNERVKFLISRMYAKKAGLPYINFYTNMPNAREYVRARIHDFLK